MTSSTPGPTMPGLAHELGLASAGIGALATHLANGTYPDAGVAALTTGRLSVQLAEAAETLRAWPATLVDDEPWQWQLLGALRNCHESGRDLAAMIGVALARLAAELGSMAAVTAARPGSWEASLVAQLLEGTAGDDTQLRYWRAAQ